MHMSSLFSDEGWSPEGAVAVDLRYIEGTTCYCDATAEKAIEDALKPLPINALHWIDGGDFHYLSNIWMRRIERPFQLLLIDNHPDDQQPAFNADIMSCGGWVAHARKNNSMLQTEAELVYVSIDLDWLTPDYARTNWDQGTGSLEELFQLLTEQLAGKRLAGVDICGGITSLQGGTAEDFAINRRTRNALLQFFSSF